MNCYRLICILLSGVFFLTVSCKSDRISRHCHDGIQNHNESGVDCGSNCKACSTCFDGIQNQEETSIDCGGPCKSCPTEYAERGLHGPNILSNVSSAISGNSYSARVDIKENISVKVIIKNTSEDNSKWVHSALSVTGWTALGYDQANKSQQFIANGKKICDVELRFQGEGSAVIEIYENGSVKPTYTNPFSWRP